MNSIKSDFFSELPSIKLIDLRFNRLFFIEKLQLSNADVKVFLFGNFWDCTKNLKWIATNDYKFDIIDKEMMNCSDQKYRARPILTVMNYKMILSKSCQQDPELRNCSCHISYLRLDIDTNTFHPMFSVNCSNAGFYEFPRQLPVNTTTLFISNNQITSLNMLCTRNSTYGGIHDMYLDYNQISDVSVLDNCEWWDIRFIFIRYKESWDIIHKRCLREGWGYLNEKHNIMNVIHYLKNKQMSSWKNISS